MFEFKEIITAHHLVVPHRPLEPVPKKSLNHNKKNPLDDNLVIHGDNLEALKALLPMYGGKVKCIYIDPPYNTGNENWVYNDNVASPEFKGWLKKTVDSEDLERHDKWCCMMWPRLKLLRELLAEDGAIFISVDDHEQHHLRMMMDEIFGKFNFISNIIWQKKSSPQNDAKYFSDNHDFILVYAKKRNRTENDGWVRKLIPHTAEQIASYRYDDNDGRGPWRPDNLSVKTYSKSLDYPITNPNTGEKHNPPRGSCWRVSREKTIKFINENRIYFTKNGFGRPQLKRYLNEVQQGVVPKTVWLASEVGHTTAARKEIKNIFHESENPFDNPKPHSLIQHILKLSTDRDDIVLDSFAGSGTTAHAVLNLNREDGGDRRFILVECEDYADKITAERVRRVIKGYSQQKGTGGSFAYCTLGDPIDVEQMLSGASLPDFSTLASYLLYVSSLISTTRTLKPKRDHLFYSTDATDYYLLYEPDVKYLQSSKSGLTEKRARKIFEKNRHAIVFATGKEMSQRDLSKMNIEFCRLPDVVLGNANP